MPASAFSTEWLPPADQMWEQAQEDLPSFLDQMESREHDAALSVASCKLLPHQELTDSVVDSVLRALIVAARRSGKTYHYAHKLSDRAMRFDEGMVHEYRRLNGHPARNFNLEPPRFMYVAPEREQAMQIIWPYLSHIHSAFRSETKLSHSDGSLTFLKNNAKVLVRGAMKPDSLRGQYLDGVVFDEAGFMDLHGIWRDMEPQLLQNNGFAWFSSTPNGRNHFYAMLQNALSDEAGEWGAIVLPASAIKHFNSKILEQYRRDHGEHAYQQEMECSFDAPPRGVFWGDEIMRIRSEGQEGSFPANRDLPAFASIDLGVNDAMVIWCGQIDVNRRVVWFDCIHSTDESLEWIVEQLDGLRIRNGIAWSRWWLPPDVENRDISVSVSKRAGGASTKAKKRIDVLREIALERGVIHPSRIEVIGRHRVNDRITIARTVFQSSLFNTANSRVAHGLNALSLYQREWDGKNQAFSTKPKHDWTSDFADSFGYGAWMLNTYKKQLIADLPKAKASERDSTVGDRMMEILAPDLGIEGARGSKRRLPGSFTT